MWICSDMVNNVDEPHDFDWKYQINRIPIPNKTFQRANTLQMKTNSVLSIEIPQNYALFGELFWVLTCVGVQKMTNIRSNKRERPLQVRDNAKTAPVWAFKICFLCLLALNSLHLLLFICFSIFHIFHKLPRWVIINLLDDQIRLLAKQAKWYLFSKQTLHCLEPTPRCNIICWRPNLYTSD